MKYKIIADSSCDLKSTEINENVSLAVVPLFIHVDNQDFTDNYDLDVSKMLEAMNAFKGKSTSACPSPQSFLDHMTGADKYFLVTISSKLSGSFNSAELAKNSFEKPKNVEVIDTQSTSGAARLVVEKLIELINDGKEYKDIATGIREYISHNLNTNFVLDKFDNLVKNGRLSLIKAIIAETLNVKLICEGVEGEIKVAKKSLGLNRAIRNLVEYVDAKVAGAKGKKCIITQCMCEETAQRLKAAFEEKCGFKSIEVTEMRGLNSFYAMEKGFIVCYEN